MASASERSSSTGDAPVEDERASEMLSFPSYTGYRHTELALPGRHAQKIYASGEIFLRRTGRPDSAATLSLAPFVAARRRAQRHHQPAVAAFPRRYIASSPAATH